MEQAKINPKDRVATPDGAPSSIDKLGAVIYKDGDSYCCILGSDAQSGVFGCGDTPEEAATDWDAHLQSRLQSAGQDDPVIEHVKSIISQRKQTLFDEFAAQFRPVDRNKITKRPGV